MSGTSRSRPFGPSLPPSTWPLDHVPGTILDIIVHCIEEDAIDSHSCKKCPDCLWVTKPVGPIYTPLSLELKNMSLVDHTFRKAILQKVILDTVALYDCNQIRSALSCLQEESYRYINQIVFKNLYNEDRPSLTQILRKRFLSKCSTLTSVIDETIELAYMSHTYAATTSILILVLLGGDEMPAVVRAPGLTTLVIQACSLTWPEHPRNLEGAYWHDKVKFMCHRIKHLQMLNLGLPGLCVEPGYDKSRLPAGFSFKDMLPVTLESIFILHLDSKFCTVDSGSKREAHWYGYFRWLFETTPRITHLLIKMQWNERYVGATGADRTPRVILDSMGLPSLDYDPARNPSSYAPDDVFTMSLDMREFLSSLLKSRDGMESITIQYDVDIDIYLPAQPNKTKTYRILYLTKGDGPKRGQGKISFNDTIEFQILDAIIRKGG